MRYKSYPHHLKQKCRKDLGLTFGATTFSSVAKKTKSSYCHVFIQKTINTGETIMYILLLFGNNTMHIIVMCIRQYDEANGNEITLMLSLCKHAIGHAALSKEFIFDYSTGLYSLNVFFL